MSTTLLTARLSESNHLVGMPTSGPILYLTMIDCIDVQTLLRLLRLHPNPKRGRKRLKQLYEQASVEEFQSLQVVMKKVLRPLETNKKLLL